MTIVGSTIVLLFVLLCALLIGYRYRDPSPPSPPVGGCADIANKLTPECLNSTIDECFNVLACSASYCDGLTTEVYTGPDYTLDVGSCHAGLLQCNNSVVEVVIAEVVPEYETCIDPNEDLDCDGLSGCTDLDCFLEPLCINSTYTQCFDVLNCNAAYCNGLTRECYNGDPYLIGVGACDSGMETCNGTVKTGCVGEVLQGPEVCDDPYLDANCDGFSGCDDSTCHLDAVCLNQTIDDCLDTLLCSEPYCDGLSRECYTGNPALIGVGACASGIESCNGTSKTSCEGEVLPSAEVCSDPLLDADCDGLAGCDDPDCAANLACINDTVQFCIDNQCGETFCEGVERACYYGPPGTLGVGTCVAGVEGCDLYGVLFNCTDIRPLDDEVCDGTDRNCNGVFDEGFFPAVGTDCSSGNSSCANNGTYVCNAYGNGTVCNASPSGATVVTVMVVDETAPGAYTFAIDANFSFCESATAELFTYLVRFGRGKDSAFSDAAISYAQISVLSVTANGDCSANPDFFYYGPYDPDPSDGTVLYPAHPVAFLTSPMAFGTCHVEIVTESPYFGAFDDMTGYSRDRLACIPYAGNSTLRAHNVAIVVDGTPVATATDEFIRCPYDAKLAVSVNPFSTSPLRHDYTFDFALRDMSTPTSLALRVRDYFPTMSLSMCTFTTTDILNCHLASGDAAHWLVAAAWQTDYDDFYMPPPVLPVTCRVVARCQYDAVPPSYEGNATAYMVNEIAPKYGPYKDAPYGNAVLGIHRVTDSVMDNMPPEMVFDSVVTNYVTLSGTTLTVGPNCGDEVQNGDETDVDCGGGTCIPCLVGDSCDFDEDCFDGPCVGSVCT